MIQLRRPTNSLRIPWLHSRLFVRAAPEKLFGSAHYPSRARFTGVQFVFRLRFVSFSTKPEITRGLRHPVSNLPVTIRFLPSISPLSLSLSRSCPSFSTCALPQETCIRVDTGELLLSLPPRWIHEVKAWWREVGFYPVIGLQRKLDYFKCNRTGCARRPNASQDVSVWLTIIPRIGMVIRVRELESCDIGSRNPKEILREK